MEAIPSVKVTELTLEHLKNYLRVEYNYDDTELQTILVSAKSYIQTYLNKRFDEFDELPDEFTISCLAICAYWYKNKDIEREGTSVELPHVFSGILDMYREWLGDE